MSIFNEFELAAILISCLCHDIQHSGRTDTHLINTNNRLALLYNDQTILENHHASVTFRLTLNSPSVNIFAELSSEEYHSLRSMIIDSILVTDISKHFEYVQRFSLRDKQIDRHLLTTIEENLVSRRATLLIKSHSRSMVQINPIKPKESISDVSVSSLLKSCSSSSFMT